MESNHYKASGRTLAAIQSITQRRLSAYKSRERFAVALGGTGRVVGTDEVFEGFEVPQMWKSVEGWVVGKVADGSLVAAPDIGKAGKRCQKRLRDPRFRLPGLWDFAGLCGVPAVRIGSTLIYPYFRQIGENYVVMVPALDSPAPLDCEPLGEAAMDNMLDVANPDRKFVKQHQLSDDVMSGLAELKSVRAVGHTDTESATHALEIDQHAH